MKLAVSLKTLLLNGLCLVLLTACEQPCPPPEVTGDYQNPELPTEDRVEDLLSHMTLEEKLEMMGAPKSVVSVVTGLFVPFETTKNCRLGIPPFKTLTLSGSRGSSSRGTAFPVGMSRGASWDLDLEYRVHEAIALEAAAFEQNLLLSPVLTIVRHPGMGRAQETYGEDTFHMGEFGIVAINGAQTHLPAQAKHYALNSIEENRYTIDVQLDERTLREIYLPHYRKAVQVADVATIMTAYNRVNGIYASENRHLLTGILRDEWGFEGILMSDWMDGVNSTVDAANNGLDIEMPIANYFKVPKLLKAINDGDVSEDTIDEINRRIMRQKLKWGHFDERPVVPRSVIKSTEMRTLALEAAREGMTLLKNNNNSLPLNRHEIEKLVVLGTSADILSLGDQGSSAVYDIGPDSVTPLQGIMESAFDTSVSYHPTLETEAARSETESADAVVVVASLTPYDEGEWIQQYQLIFPGQGGDRRDLSLHEEDVELIQWATANNDRVIVVIQAGSAVTVSEWEADAEAVLMAWYPGVKGGTAIGETIFGENNPSGKTPISWPVDESDLYEFGSRQDSVVYGFLHGYRYYDALDIEPQYPFGHGLSYTEFSYSDLSLSVESNEQSQQIKATFKVTNTGNRPGKEVPQLYVGYNNSEVERAPKDLKGFSKLSLQPGEIAEVTLLIPSDELKYWNTELGTWVLEDIEYTVHVGSSSRSIHLESAASFTSI